MKRRNFMKLLSASTLIPLLDTREAKAETTVAPYSGDFLFTVKASGGFYQGTFCDPKENTKWGEGKYGSKETAGKAGGIAYANAAENVEFFEKYYQDMLVINGVKWASNGHSHATFDQQSGSTVSSFPSISAIHAKINGAGMPMPWLVASHSKAHAPGGIQPYTILPARSMLSTLAEGGAGQLPEQDMSILAEFQNARSDELLARRDILPFAREKIRQLKYSRNNRTLLKNLANNMPEDLDTKDLKGNSDDQVSEIHQTLISMKEGVCVAGYASVGGFDTHTLDPNTKHDNFKKLTRTIDYLWTKATELGIADRLVVHVASDVGRPRNGNGHSTTGSTIIMGRNRPWTNRTVGVTNDSNRSLKINPNTLQADPDGEQLRSGHVHVALREILGVTDHPTAQLYSLRGVSEINLLDPSLSSPTFI